MLESLTLDGTMELVLIGGRGLQPTVHSISLAMSAADVMRETATEFVERLRTMEQHDFEPDRRITTGQYAFLHMERLAPPQAANAPTAASRIDIDSDLVRLIQNAEARVSITGDELEPAKYSMFILIFTTTDGEQTIFLRRHNPANMAKPKHRVFSFGSELHAVTNKILTFDSNFDLVISTHGLLIVNATFFEEKFRDLTVLTNVRASHVTHLQRSLPLSAASSAQLVEIAEALPSVAKKMRSINENGIFAEHTPTVSEIQAYAQEAGLDVPDLVVANELNITRTNAVEVFTFLNEDMYKGQFSGRTLISQHKTIG